MSDYQSRINKLVEDFVSQVTALARQAATDTLANALGAAGVAARGRRSGGGGAVESAPVARAGRRPKGAKRAQGEIERTKSRVHDFIRQNPGMRIEQINRQLGTTTRDLALPLKKLIADGAVRTEGEKRSTQYFPGDGKARDGGGPKRRKKK